MANKTAYLDAPGTPLRIGDSEIPIPGPDDIVVKNHAIAINPVDNMISTTGLGPTSWPIVLGSDLAGSVHAVGANLTRFKPGDRVIGFAQWLIRRTPADGAFSLYTRLPAGNAAILPDGISYTDGAVLGMAIGTAVSGLNEEKCLGLPFPSLTPAQTGGVLVVYGASSSIGSMATQLATASGIRVIAIASPANFELCRQCGATDTFSYKHPTVVDEVVAAVGSDTFVGIFESISSSASYKISLAILEKLGGGRMACSPPGPTTLPGNVKAEMMIAMGEHSIPVFEHFVTQALESGQLKCQPPPLVVGNGLESLQTALETLQAGVSGRKMVVTL